MSAKADLYQAREKMLAVLDAKLKGMPEWEAFRALERAIAGIAEPLAPKGGKKRRAKKRVSYADLGHEVLMATDKPLPTADMVKFIAANKGLSAEDRKVKINIQSALSHDARFKNVAWRGGRAWWFADRPVPADESAGQSLRL